MRQRIRTIAILGAAFALLAGAAGCGVDEIEDMRVQSDLHECLDLAFDGNMKRATIFADQAIALAPDKVDTYVSTAKDEDTAEDDRLDLDSILMVVGQYRLDEHYLQQAIKDFPKAYQPLEHLMYVQQRLGETAASVQTAKSLVALLNSTFAKGNLNDTSLTRLGDAYYVSGDHVNSAATYGRVISIYPTNFDVYNHAAMNFADANDVPNLKQALNYANLALSKARQQNKPDETIAAIQDTVGWVQYRMGDYKDALGNIEHGVETDEREPECRYHLAMVEMAMGDKAAAKAEVQRIMQLTPEYADGTALDAQLKDVAPTPSLTVADVINPTSGPLPGYPGLQPATPPTPAKKP